MACVLPATYNNYGNMYVYKILKICTIGKTILWKMWD